MVTAQEIIKHYETIRPFIEGDGSAMKEMLHTWCPAFFQDAQEDAETIMLAYGMDVADRYLYGLLSCVTSARFENARTLPPMSDARYQELSSNQLSIMAQEPVKSLPYDAQLFSNFSQRLPITNQVMEILRRGLALRPRVTPEEINFGFLPGTRKSVMILAEVMRQ